MDFLFDGDIFDELVFEAGVAVSSVAPSAGVPPYARAKRSKINPIRIPAISMQVIRRAREEREEFLVL